MDSKIKKQLDKLDKLFDKKEKKYAELKKSLLVKDFLSINNDDFPVKIKHRSTYPHDWDHLTTTFILKNGVEKTFKSKNVLKEFLPNNVLQKERELHGR